MLELRFECQNVGHKLFEKCVGWICEYLHPCVRQNGVLEVRSIQLIITIHAADVVNQCIKIGEIVCINKCARIEILGHVRCPPVNGDAPRFVCVAYFFGHISGILFVFKCNRKLVLFVVFYFAGSVYTGRDWSADVVQMHSPAIHALVFG